MNRANIVLSRRVLAQAFRYRRDPVTLTLLALWTLASIAAIALQACASVPPNVVQGGVAGIDAAVCVLNTFSKDKEAGKSDGDAIADCVQLCAVDTATAIRILDAHRAAELREQGK